MGRTFDSIIIGSGQAGPFLAARLAGAGKNVALVERKFLGGTCVNTGCTPTKTLVASAKVAYTAREAAHFGVHFQGEVQVSLAEVKSRADRILLSSRESVGKMLAKTECTVIHGQARFVSAHEIAVGEEILRGEQFFINVGGRAAIAAPSTPGVLTCTKRWRVATLKMEGETMKGSELIASDSAETASAATVDMKLEVVVIPVSDVGRSKEFYARLGWRLDADFKFENGFRVVQFTPPGSMCSVQFGTKLTSASPGAAQGIYLVVPDISAARDEIASHGVDISMVFHPVAPGAQFQPEDASSLVNGPAPGHPSYGSFATFSDPDGNRWLLQEVTTRLPGRVAGETVYNSSTDLSQALQRAAAAHGRHEALTGKADPNWPDWYAEYLVREQSGAAMPE